MQFNSYIFIFSFLPVTVLTYFLANKVCITLGKIVLIISSIVFYSLNGIKMLVILGASVLINYGSAFAVRRYGIKNKLILALPVIVNICLLLFFKYLNFAITNINFFTGSTIGLRNIILPLGISFYTFQQIAYIVAVERNELEDCGLIDYLAYILYFPKLLMGPLADPVDMISQLNREDKKKADISSITTGIKIFSLGLVKKVLIADTFAKAVSWTYENLDTATSMDCLLLILFYTFVIYFDFSGYCDMATGVSSMLNIDLPINFDSPYKALSVRDFWRRWHITLTWFLTKYIYIPLGGSRKGDAFTYINIMIVFLVSGLWHGANWTFILWGSLHGIFVCLDRMFGRAEDKVPAVIRRFCTFCTVSVLWLLFSAGSVKQWVTILLKVVQAKTAAVSVGLLQSFDLPESRFIWDLAGFDHIADDPFMINMIIFIGAAFAVCFIPENNYRRKDTLNSGSLLLASAAFVWGILCLGIESTFVYFGF